MKREVKVSLLIHSSIDLCTSGIKCTDMFHKDPIDTHVAMFFECVRACIQVCVCVCVRCIVFRIFLTHEQLRHVSS